MLNIGKIKGLIFDYGATIDSNGKHWSEVLWDAYQTNQVPVKKHAFKDAYIYGEKYLALHFVIQPDFTFKDVLLAKTNLQLKWLIEQGFLPLNCNSSEYSLAISNQCYIFVIALLEKTRPILKELASKYPLVLVSNFYGNMEAVLKDFRLDTYFEAVIESAVVGIRKPDPKLFLLGVEALHLNPESVVVIGDSYEKDIFPAASLGCRTIWLRGAGWETEIPDGVADRIIDDFEALREIFEILKND
jgi:putative hydrolase of the HAD superfamily